MPRPERSAQQGAPQVTPQQMNQAPPIQSAPRQVSQSTGTPMSSGGIREDIRALNSSILLISQKIKYLVRNEKILGRNLVVLNKKIKTLEEKVVSIPTASVSGGASAPELEVMKQKVSMLEAQMEDLITSAALKEELKELKYIINSINPLEFATLTQVRELIDKRMEEKLGKK
jgi:predicted RNase H-like nuclease (RuvC/YqgF family)